MEKLEEGINFLRGFFITHKKIQAVFPDFMGQLNSIDPQSKRKAVMQHKRLGIFLHSLNLLRWYGHYRNKGEYNKDCVYQVRSYIQELIVERESFKPYIEDMFPSPHSIKEFYTQAKG